MKLRLKVNKKMLKNKIESTRKNKPKNKRKSKIINKLKIKVESKIKIKGKNKWVKDKEKCQDRNK
jgi:hypothetical protein